MAVKSRDEILNSVKAIMPDVTTDDAISLLEDISDSMGDDKINALNKELEETKNKLAENDKTWRQKYTDRFYSNGDEDLDEFKNEPKPKNETEEKKKPMTYDDLFSEVKENA